LQKQRVLGAVFLLVGLALTISGFYPLAIVYNTPTYTADAIILYNAAFPTLTYDESISMYRTRLYYQINFNPPTADTKYYYLVEAYNVSAKTMWGLFFYNPSTGSLGSGVGAWIMEPNQKFSGVEIAGYTLIPWTWQRNGTDYMVLDLKADTQPSGCLKVYIKWAVPPPPTYTITVSATCQGLNQQIIIQGAITPPVGAKPITITVTYPSGLIKKRYINTAIDGTFNYTDPDLTATEKGTYIIQAQVDTTTSQPYTLTIGEEKPTPKPAPIPTTAIIGIGFIAIGIVLLTTKRK
jgi:hypothetical protein